jgi:adenylosuccinate lyase
MEEQLRAISPVDGRYHKVTKKLGNYFSEFALIQYRLRIEVEYFIALCELPLPQLQNFNRARFIELRDIYLDFDIKDATRIKEIEKTTNHDVKAVEYFLKEHFEKLGLEQFQEFIHFGLTSQDINNTSVPLSIKEYIETDYLALLGDVVVMLSGLAEDWDQIPMLARTHGQPASPTRLGKELMVFVERLDQQMRLLRHIPFAAKFGGATGNFNAHHLTYPSIDWKNFGHQFVEEILGMQHSWPTTQIEHYDHLAALFDCLKRINTIILDLDRDMWTYISMDYFKQKIKEGEVGSSAMPHKVNPIDFENSEGNLGLANALFEHLSAKLPISRLQRDLTDSTVLRNVGVPISHTVIALNATMKGLQKLVLNRAALEADLEANWAVVAEGIQNILRREGYPKPYEALKALTRTNEGITETSIKNFIKSLNISDLLKMEMLAISPQNYTGL